MIAIYTLSGQEIQLQAGSVFTINWISTAFNDDDQFLGSYSYPVALSYCPSNNKILGMGNRLENRSGRQDITVMVRIFGIHWKKCTLSFTIDTDSYSAYLKIDNGVFANILKNTLLTDLFVTKNANGDFIGYIYEQYTTSLVETNQFMLDGAKDTTGKYPVCFLPVYNPGLLGNYTGDAGSIPAYDDRYGMVNAYTAGIGYNIDSADEPPSAFFYTPFYNLIYITKKVLSFLGFTAGGDFFTDPMILDKVIYNTGVFSSLDIIDSSGLKFSPAQHLPAISISDFLKFLRTNFKLAIYFDPDLAICTCNIIRNTLKSRTRVDISGCVSPQYSIKSDMPDGYELVQPVDSSDSLFQTNPYAKSYYIGNTEDPTSVDNFISTLFMGTVTPAYSAGVGDVYRLPVANQLGNAYSAVFQYASAYNAAGYGNNPFDLRLLTCRGMVNNKDGHSYPYASTDDLAIDGQTSDYGMSLWLGGAKGLLATYNAEYYNFFLRTELVELDAVLPMRLLQQITPVGLLEFRTPSQAIIPAMLNDMTFEASQNERRLESKMRVYPIYSQKDVDTALISTFVVSQVVNPNTYVKFSCLADLANSTYDMVKGQKVYRNIKVKIGLYFYSDQEGTIPKILPKTLSIIIHYSATLINGDKTSVTFDIRTETASGSYYECADLTSGQDAIYLGSGNYAYRKFKYNIAVDPGIIGANPGYHVIGDIYGGYVPPS